MHIWIKFARIGIRTDLLDREAFKKLERNLVEKSFI